MPLRCLSCPSPRSTMQTCLSPRATAKHPRPATPRSVAATTTSPTCGSPRPNNSSCSVATANAHVGANEDCSSADVPRLQAQAQAQLELLALLESRERDLSLSAEIGSALLQTTEELKTQLSDRTRELGLAETRIQNLEHANSVLAEKAAQAAQYLHQAEDETWGARRELAEVRAALEVAQTDKTHAADALARLTADHALLQQCAAVTKFDADAKAASAAAEIARSRFDSKNAVEEATKFKEENARLKDRVAQLESAEQRLGPHHENAALLRHQVATLREDLRLSEEAVELRDAQLRELQSLLAQHEARFLHSQIERAALQRQIAILTEQLENAAGHGAARRCLSVLDHHYDTRDKRSSTASVVGAAAAAAPAATTGLSYSPSHVLREADENAQLFSTTSSSLSSVLSASSGASVIADAVAAAEAGAEGEVGAATRLAGGRPLGPPSLRRSSASSPASHLVAVASPPGSQPAFSPKRVSWTPSRDWLAAAASGVFSPVSRPDLGSYVAARLSTDAASRAPLPPTTHTTNAPSGGAGATPGMPVSARCSLPAARCSLPAHPPPQLAKISLSPAPLASSRSASSPPQVQPQTQSVPTCSPVSHHHTVLPADPAAAPAAQLQPIFFSCAYSSSAPESARSNCTEDAAARPGAPHPLSGSSTTSAHSDLELEPDTARLEAAAAGGVAPSGGVALPTSPAELLDLLSDSRQRSNYLAARLGRSTRRNQWLLQDNERLREQLATLRAEYAALLQATRQRLDRMQEKNAKPCRYPVCIPRSWIPTSSKDLR